MLIRSFFNKKTTKVRTNATSSPVSVEKCSEWQDFTTLRSLEYCTALTNITSWRNLFTRMRRNLVLRGDRWAVRPVSTLILVLGFPVAASA